MRMILTVSAACFLASACATPDGGRTNASATTSLLADMRAACGGDAWDDVEGWHETGQVTLPGGMTANYESWSQMHRLQTASRAFAGEMQLRHVGFDGASFWSVGQNGEAAHDRSPEKIRTQRRDAYISSHAYFLPDRFPAGFELAGTQSKDGKTYTVLHVTPENAGSVDLWVDQKDFLVRRIEAGTEFVDLDNYRTFNGVCTATTGRQGGDGPSSEITLKIETVSTGAVDDAVFLAPPN